MAVRSDWCEERGAGRRNRLWATGLPRTPLRSGRPDRKSSGSGAKQRGYGTRPKFAAENKLANVEVLNCDARATSLPRGAFDLATARLVLVNIPEPEEVVAEMDAAFSVCELSPSNPVVGTAITPRDGCDGTSHIDRSRARNADKQASRHMRHRPAARSFGGMSDEGLQEGPAGGAGSCGRAARAAADGRASISLEVYSSRLHRQPHARVLPRRHPMTAFKVGNLIGSLAKGSINRKLAKALVNLAPDELSMAEIPFKDLPLYSYD